VVRTTVPYDRTLGFLDRSRYFPIKYPLSCTHEAEWTPFQTHCFSENLVVLGIEPGPPDAGSRSSSSSQVCWVMFIINTHVAMLLATGVSYSGSLGFKFRPKSWLYIAEAFCVTGRRGPQGSETSRLPHILANRLTDASYAVSLTRRPPFTFREIPGTHLH
jgi:hypothetical protein